MRNAIPTLQQIGGKPEARQLLLEMQRCREDLAVAAGVGRAREGKVEALDRQPAEIGRAHV